MVAVVHRYTQKTWAFLVGQRHRQTPEISQGNAHAYTQASTIAFKGFDEIGDFLNLKTIANAILQYFAPNINKVFDMDTLVSTKKS